MSESQVMLPPLYHLKPVLKTHYLSSSLTHILSLSLHSSPLSLSHTRTVYLFLTLSRTHINTHTHTHTQKRMPTLLEVCSELLLIEMKFIAEDKNLKAKSVRFFSTFAFLFLCFVFFLFFFCFFVFVFFIIAKRNRILKNMLPWHMNKKPINKYTMTGVQTSAASKKKFFI